jgi:hypothetical protein
MATYGIPGTPTYSVSFNTLDEMLAVLADNNEQSIQASDVRNSIFTLWGNYISGMGPQGFQGPQGITGVGLQGSMGSQGFQGNIGGMGAQGFQGTPGPGFTGSVGLQGYQGNQGNQGVIGLQGFQGTGIIGSQGIQGVIGQQGPQGINGSPGIVNYEIAIEMSSGLPVSIISASASNGQILYDGVSWASGWSGIIENTDELKIDHPLNARILNMTTHGVNGNNIYSISVYGKSPAGTQYCTLIQGLTFSSFTLYGISYLSTGCSQVGTTEVVVTFQA